MKKLKLSLKIVAALFIFAVFGLLSCNKSQLGLDESGNAYSETADGNVVQQDVTTDMVIADLENKEGIKITENYYHEETGVTGTLYEYVNYEGVTKQVLKADKKPENIEEKGWLPFVYSVRRFLVTDPDGGLSWESRCNGANSGCFGWTDFYIIYD